MPKRRDVPCARGCGNMLWTGATAGVSVCNPCRGKRDYGSQPAECSDPECSRLARAMGMCKTHYNKATGHYIGNVVKDPDRERARLRIRTHRRKDASRLTDITPEYEMALRSKAKRCPLCMVKLTDEPYRPHSKELDAGLHVQHLPLDRGHQAAEMRQSGMRWWDIADALGFGRESSALLAAERATLSDQ